jgi:hypothetical protein
MKTFNGYIIDNCKCIESDYMKNIMIYIYYELLQEIKKLFDLDEIKLLEYELFK